MNVNDIEVFENFESFKKSMKLLYTALEFEFLISVYEENPPLAVVQRFVHLLDTSDADYAEELGKWLKYGYNT